MKLTLQSYFEALTQALADSDELAALAKETQPGKPWRVYQGFNLAAERDDVPTPSVIALPVSDVEASDVMPTLTVMLQLRLKDASSLPATSSSLVVCKAPALAMRWADAIVAAIKERVRRTDARTTYFSKEFDFTTFAEKSLVTVTFTAVAPLPPRLSRSWTI